MFSILPLMDNKNTNVMGTNTNVMGTNVMGTNVMGTNVMGTNVNTIVVDTPEHLNVDFITLKKMGFIYNAIETGWSVKKSEDKYIFSKKHEGKKEVYLESYLRKFIETNMDISNMT